MGDKSAISWTDATWNPWQGCHKVSPSCKFCYMYREKKQYGQDPAVVIRSKPHTFNLPRRLKTAQRVFTCSWSDFFIEEADDWRNEAWEIIENTPHLTYQILTKRPERARSVLPFWWWLRQRPPMPNVWIGVSVENQETANLRLPLLMTIPTELRFLSIEPLLSYVDLEGLWGYPGSATREQLESWPIRWVIVGGESGARPREMDPRWLHSIIDQCDRAEVPVFVKQDSGLRPGRQGLIPDAIWARKDFPQ